ncbi:MAG: HAMP domain-containing protein [Deltaproteobacteria bacterium]|nr:HAMP domain-containing protein [Deltaproteobacteria bacterium]
MRSLFPRLLVSFWVSLTAVAVASTFIQVASSPPAKFIRRSQLMSETLRLVGEDAAARAGSGDAAGAERLIRGVESRLGIRVTLLVDDRVAAGAQPTTAMSRLSRQQGNAHAARSEEIGDVEVFAVPVPRRPDARILAEVPNVPRWERLIRLETLPLRLLVLFVVSGLVSFLLARYLSRPLQVLRRATQRLARGELSVRVAPEVESAGTEVAELGRDFDRMAERVAGLLEAQHRLLRDVSHELRSPLARVNVALELARQRAGADASGPLDRIERETERLNELIGQILTMSRLESDGPTRSETIDLSGVLDDVVSNAEFEAKGRDRHVAIVGRAPVSVVGSREILHRAIENVVRNAASFTHQGTTVEVRLSEIGSNGSTKARIEVRDRGPGVPEDALTEIFRPFYRVGTARDRLTGGTGVGLAIADRAVRMHGGSVEAKNAEGGGLIVTIELPIAT